MGKDRVGKSSGSYYGASSASSSSGAKGKGKQQASHADLNSRPGSPEYTYDPHGNKHFPGRGTGGGKGTQWTAGPDEVNPQLVGRLKPDAERMARHAGTGTGHYYQTGEPLAGVTPKKHDVTIQASYTPNPSGRDQVVYHGYPDANVTRYSLSHTKGGPDLS